MQYISKILAIISQLILRHIFAKVSPLESIYVVYYPNYITQSIPLYAETIIIVWYNWLRYNWWVEDGLYGLSFINIGGKTTIDERRRMCVDAAKKADNTV